MHSLACPAHAEPSLSQISSQQENLLTLTLSRFVDIDMTMQYGI